MNRVYPLLINADFENVGKLLRAGLEDFLLQAVLHGDVPAVPQRLGRKILGAIRFFGDIECKLIDFAPLTF